MFKENKGRKYDPYGLTDECWYKEKSKFRNNINSLIILHKDKTILGLNFRILCKTIQISLVTEKESFFVTGKIKSWLFF